MYAKDGILVLLIYEHIESHHTTSTTIFIQSANKHKTFRKLKAH